MTYQKKDFKSVYLNDFKMISGIMDLTLQDVIGAMILMIRSGILTKARSSLWSKVIRNPLRFLRLTQLSASQTVRWSLNST